MVAGLVRDSSVTSSEEVFGTSFRPDEMDDIPGTLKKSFTVGRHNFK